VGVFVHACVGLGDIVLMAGGQDSFDPTGRTVIIDAKTGSAREVASLKSPRVYASMVLYKGKALILGGNYRVDVSQSRSDGEVWNMDTETWEEAEIHLNNGRQAFSLVTMAEEIHCD